MTAITDIVTVTVNVADTALTRQGFGTALLVGDIESAVFTSRTQIVNNITEVAALFDVSDDVYLAAAAFFAQQNRPPFLKIGRQEAADADLAEALVEIANEDDDFYYLCLVNHTDGDLIDAKNFIAPRTKIGVFETSEATVKAAGTPLSVTGITRVGQTATAVAAVAHGLANGDLVVVSGANQAEYNGTFVIENITTTDFDYTVSGSPTTPATGTIVWAPGDVLSLFKTQGQNRVAVLWHQNADTEFPASAWAHNLRYNPGESTWAYKALTGISGSTIADLDATEEAYIIGNNGNVYPLIGNTGVSRTRLGTMASGRFIDVQRSQDWIETEISLDIITRLLNEPKVPYTDKGVGILVGDINKVMEKGKGFGMIGPLDASESGEFWQITTEKVAAQSPADRAVRHFPGIVVTAQFAGAIHTTAITVNVSI